MSYLLAAMGILFMIIAYAFNKAPVMLIATIVWMAFSVHVASLDMDSTLQMGITSLGGILALFTALQSLYQMGVLPRQESTPTDEARQNMDMVRKQVSARRIRSGDSNELDNFDYLVKRSQKRLARDRIRRKGYRLD